MMIEDDELRTIFKTASEEHLQKLDEGLLHLEHYPGDRPHLEALLREAHSLKGDSNMLGQKDIGTLAHQIEHLLGSVKRGEIELDGALCDRLYQGMDAIRKLVQEAVTGTPAGVNTFYTLALLMGASPSPAPESVETTPETAPNGHMPESAGSVEQEASPGSDASDGMVPVTERSIPQPEVPDLPAEGAGEISGTIPAIAATANSSPSQNGQSAPAQPAEPTDAQPLPTYQIDTIRVEAHKLDALMTQAGELTVTKVRMAHRLNDIEALVTLWEEWSREAFVHRFSLDQLEHRAEASLSQKNGSPQTRRRQTANLLPQLQALFAHTDDRLERMGAIVTRLRNAIYEDTARLDMLATDLEEGVRTLRLLPLATIFNLFPRMVRDLARQQGKQVELIIEGGDTRADKRILEEMKDPLMHMIRNAIDHGVELPEARERVGKSHTARIWLRGYQTPTSIVLEVADDGKGLDLDNIKRTAVQRGLCRTEELAAMTPEQIQSLIFAPGFSTRTLVTEVSGRGVGLDVVRTNVERLKGSVLVESTPGQGTTLRVQMGITLATAHVLILQVNGIAYALPVEFVETTLLIQAAQIFSIEGRQAIALNGQPISVVPLADLLELPQTCAMSQDNVAHRSDSSACIILRIGQERLGVLVDALLDEQDVVLKPQSKLLKRVRNVSGATILGTGEVCMVLNPVDLLKSLQKRAIARTLQPAVQEAPRKPVVLLVEDSIATRTQEKRILEGAGYEVVTAVDGVDGFNKLRTRQFDAIVTDIEMPNLDGLSLTSKIRQQREYSELPIILVTSLASEDDKRRGAEAGANAYITKGGFDQKALIETLRLLV